MKFWSNKKFKLGLGPGIFVLILLLAGNALAASCDSCLFVKPGGNDTSDGFSWDTAKETIAAALRTASSGDTIHVAPGTYPENITLKSHVNLLGGYSSSGGRALYTSIIDGMDSSSVVTASNLSGGKLDGFTITNGNADKGGGIFVQGGSVIISNNKIEDNDASNGGGVYLTGFSGRFSNNIVQNNRASRGAGVYCTRLQAVGEIDNNTIKNNTASRGGGGIALYSSAGELYKNSIQYNTAFKEGGGVRIKDFSGLFANNLLDHNSAQDGGGGYLVDFNFEGEISNCTVANSSASGVGDGFFVDTDFDGQIKNSIIWGNGNQAIWCEAVVSGVAYCNIEGGYEGTGNINANPLFTDSYRLLGGSPSINAGDDGTNMGHTGGSEVNEPSVTNQRPVAAAGNNQAVEAASCDGADVSLGGSGSSDPDGCIVSYSWTWAGGTAGGCSPSAFFPIGTHSVTLTVSDGVLTDTDTVSITVEHTSSKIIAITSLQDEACVNSSPITVSGLVDGNCITVTVNGVEATLYDDNSFSASNVPLSEGDNEITAVVTDTVDGSTGSDTIMVTLDTIDPEVVITSPADGECVNSSPITVTYTVDGVEDSVSKELSEGANSISVEGTDDCGNTTSASIDLTLDTTPPEVVITSPADGDLVCATSITVTYTVDGEETSVPKALNEGSNTITINETDDCDNTGSDSIVVYRDIAPQVADIPDQSISEGAEFASINLDDYVTDTYDSDSDITWTYSGNSELTVSISNGVATINIPDTDWNGEERITFTATDPCEFSDSDAATFSIGAENDAPVISPTVPDITTDEDTPASLDLTGYETDVEDSDTALDWSVAGVDTSLFTASIDIDSDKLTITPVADTCGSDQVTLTLTDSGGLTDSQDITVTINCINEAPVCSDIPDQSATTGACFSSISLDNHVSDVDNQDSEISWSYSGASNLTVNISSRVATITPTTTWSGSEDITFTATDPGGLNCSDSATFADSIAPTITCPGNVTFSLKCCEGGKPANCPEIFEDFEATATDSCGAVTITNNMPGQFRRRKTTVTFTATDLAGNTSTCEATVSRKKQRGRICTINCPSDITVEQETEAGTPVTNSEIQAWLNSVSATSVKDKPLTILNNAPDVFPLGSTVVTFTAIDYRRTLRCTATLTVTEPVGLAGTSATSEENSSTSSTASATTTTIESASGASGNATSTETKSSVSDTGGESVAGGDKIAILSPANGDTLYSSPVIITYSFNGATKSISRALIEGENTITITETDSYGQTVSTSITVTLDSTTPKVAITSPENGVTVTTTPITVSYTAEGRVKTVSKALTEGTNVITIEETDSFGRVGSDTITINLASTAPVVIITSPENGATVATTPITVSYTVDGEFKSVSKELTEGKNTIGIEETDQFGRKGSDSITLNLDAGAPKLVITWPENGAVVDSTPITVKYTVDDGVAESVSKELVGGANTITVSETNAAGHTGSTSITVMLDTTAPLVTITSPKDGVTVVSSPVTVTYILDGIIKTVSKALTEGKNTVTISEADSLGRSGSDSITVTLDASAPAVVITSPKDGDTVAVTPVIVEYTVDGTPKRVSWDLVDGPNDISIKKTDLFGRTGSDSITVTLARSPLVCPKDLTVEQETSQGTNIALRASAPDPAKPVKNITSDQPKIFPSGTTTVTFTGQTKDGKTVTCSCQVTVEDTRPPRVALLLSPKKEVYLSSESFFITYLVKDKADDKPKVKLELTNGKNGKAKDITASASLPLKLADYVGDNSLTLTATDAAGNKSSVSVKFKVILKLNSSHLRITPKVLKIEPGIFTLTLTFPEPYDLGSISNVTADGAPAAEIVFEKKTIKKKVKVVKAQLKFRREKITLKPIDNEFEIKGEFVHQGSKCRFVGYAGIEKVETKQKQKK